MQRYAVIGDPIEHSLSPAIHAEFAAQCGLDLEYTRLRVTSESFADEVNEFFASGGRGLNVTSPLKSLAFDYAELVSDRAMNAGTANTLKFLDNDVVFGHNTDGEGLVQDLRQLNVKLSNQRLLLLGAGGAARGCLAALLAAAPESLHIHNRTASKAQALIDDSARLGQIELMPNSSNNATPMEPFDVVINATSASLHGARPDIDHTLFRGAVCYDLAYGDDALPFMKWTLAQGAREAHQGMGMLIEQAAASFLLWHDIRPDTAPVRHKLTQQQTHSR